MIEAENLSSMRGLKDCAFEWLFGPWGHKFEQLTYHPKFTKFKYLEGCLGMGDVEVFT